MVLKREDVLSFMNRDWAGARRHKDVSMYRYVEKHGATAAFRLGDMLLAQVWERARAAKAAQGYEGLIALRKKLDRAHAKKRH